MTIPVLLFTIVTLANGDNLTDVDNFLTTFSKQASKELVSERVKKFEMFCEKSKWDDYAKASIETHQWTLEQMSRAEQFDQAQLTIDQRKALEAIRTFAMPLSLQDWGALIDAQVELNGIYFRTVDSLESNGKLQSGGALRTIWSLYGRLIDYFANSSRQDKDGLSYYWKAWYEGQTMTRPFQTTIHLMHKASNAMGHANVAHLWNERYRSKGMQEFDVRNWSAQLFRRVLPLYEELHAYLRSKLNVNTEKAAGTIEAHLTGSLLMENWQNLYDLTRPEPSEPSLNTGKWLATKVSDAHGMLRTVANFMGHLGFDNKSTCTNKHYCKLENADQTASFTCKGEVHPFFNKRFDVGLSACMRVNSGDLNEMFNLLGQLQYAQEYQIAQPTYYQRPANPGIAIAIGKFTSLAYENPMNLINEHLVEARNWTSSLEVDHLYKMALLHLSTVTRSYAEDLWKWKLFEGFEQDEMVDYKKLSLLYWETIVQYTGIARPASVDEASVDFLNIPRILTSQPSSDQIFSTAFAFQILKHTCNRVMDNKGPLHRCDIWKRVKIGKLLKKHMEQGSSVDWADVVRAYSDGEPPSVDAMLEYFQPLLEWLTIYNDNKGLCRGWGVDESYSDEVRKTLSANRCKRNAEPKTDASFATIASVQLIVGALVTVKLVWWIF